VIPLIVLGAFTIIVVIVLVAGWLIRRTVTRAQQRVETLCPRPKQSTRANCMGHSASQPQTRGLGLLAYDKQQLVFAAGLRTRTLVIPRASITDATASKTFTRPGKSIRTAVPRVLTVHWRTDDGDEAIAGWQLPNHDTAAAFAKALRR